MPEPVPAPVFTGVGVALATLFDADGEVDVAATADHAARLVGLGMRAVVVAGSTGEASALTAGERSLLLAAVRAAVPAGTPLLAGVGAPSARQAVTLTRAARDEGADALLALSPPNVTDPRRYYQAIAAAAEGVPVLAYHFPFSSSPGIPLDVLDDLPVQGLKDSSGEAERLLRELTGWSKPVWCGSAMLLALAGPAGCAGAILALANAEPELCVAAFEADLDAAKRLVPAHVESKRDVPHGLKALMAKRFGTPLTARTGS